MHCALFKMRTMRMKFFTFSVIVLIVYLLLFLLFLDVWFMKKSASTVQISSMILPYVIVHIDLKGSPPRLDYLKSLLPILRKHGANGLLMEYEDMFPYEGKLVNLSAWNRYNRSELKNFLQTAVDTGFEIIPLVQTFGHMEHALKLQEFRHLREAPAYPDSICPSKVESRAMVKHMLEQVVNFHNSISRLKHIHVGCDEVSHINKCAQCLRKGSTERDLFIDHVRYLSTVIEGISSDTTMLIWEDMLRSIKPYEWKKIDCFNNVEPVYWDYTADLRIHHISLYYYHKKFKNIWAASAFKGADGLTATIPNLYNRVLNNFNWMKVMLDYKFGGEDRIFNFKGMILTGWSRYSHMDPPCELLPVAMPSLVLNLLLIKQFKSGIFVDNNITDVHEFFREYLKLDNNKDLRCDGRPNLTNFEAYSCNFESIELYHILKQYLLLIRDIKASFYNDNNGLASVGLYLESKHINMNTLAENFGRYNDYLNELVDVETKMVKNLKLYYYDDFINEYVKVKMYFAKTQVTQIIKILRIYSNTRVWTRGPVYKGIFGNSSLGGSLQKSQHQN